MFLSQNPQNFINEMMMLQNSSPEVPDCLMNAISSYSEKKKKPKRNRSAFILFSIDVRKKQTKQNLDELNPNDKFVKIAQLWKEASEEERQFYEQKAKQEKVKYVSELSHFCRNFPSEPIQRPRNHIKKPCNAYGYFLKEMKEEIRKQTPDMRMCEVLRVVGEKWKVLGADEKQKYEKQAEASRKTFKEEVNKQMEAVKKVKTSSGGIIVPQGKSKSEQESLVRKDVFLPELQVEQIMSLGRSTTTVENNNMCNLNQINVNKMKQEPLIVSPLAELQAKPFGAAFSVPIQPLQQGLSNVMLESLYWKVEKLRQQILVQLQNVPSQGLMTRMNYQVNPMFEGVESLVKMEQSNTYDSSSEEGYKKEEL